MSNGSKPKPQPTPAKPPNARLAELIYAQAVAERIARCTEAGSVLTTKFLQAVAEHSREAAEVFEGGK